MKTIIHLSDLHFGREDDKVLTALMKDIQQQHPALVVVSGDLTQRAKPEQFKHAKEMLNLLHYPNIIIPGNHDISLFNPFHRFLLPLYRFRKYITDQEFPTYTNDEIAIIGINTARPYLWKEGRVSLHQLNYIKNEFDKLPPQIVKIIVTHHPLFPYRSTKGSIINSKEMIQIIKESNIDLLLAGHLHLSSSDIFHFEEPVQAPKRGLFILAQASTAISKRLREEFNAYNVVTVDWPFLKIKVRRFDGKSFIDHETFIYEKLENHWHPRKM